MRRFPVPCAPPKHNPRCQRCGRWDADEWCPTCHRHVCVEQCWEPNAERCWDCLGKPPRLAAHNMIMHLVTYLPGPAQCRAMKALLEFMLRQIALLLHGASIVFLPSALPRALHQVRQALRATVCGVRAVQKPRVRPPRRWRCEECGEYLVDATDENSTHCPAPYCCYFLHWNCVRRHYGRCHPLQPVPDGFRAGLPRVQGAVLGPSRFA